MFTKQMDWDSNLTLKSSVWLCPVTCEQKQNRRELRFFGFFWEAWKPRWFLRKVMACSGRAPRCPLKSPPLATMPLISKHRQVSELISMACPDLFWGWHASLPPLKHLYKHMEIPLYIYNLPGTSSGLPRHAINGCFFGFPHLDWIHPVFCRVDTNP